MLAVLSGIVGAIVGFPGIRLANMYLDGLFYHQHEPHWQYVASTVFSML